MSAEKWKTQMVRGAQSAIFLGQAVIIACITLILFGNYILVGSNYTIIACATQSVE